MATSTAVKRRYNEKTYKRFSADIKISEFEEIEKLRGDLSRAEFLRQLVQLYKDNKEGN